MKTVRSVDVYYEAAGSHAVNRSRAEYIMSTAFGIVSNHTGRIAVASVRGVKFRLEPGKPINFDKLRLGDSQHSALVTGRAITSRDNSDIVAGHVTMGMGGFGIENDSVHSMLAVQDYNATVDITAGLTIQTGVHETGHTFGLVHCACSNCIMRPSAVVTNAYRPAEILMDGDPFCDNCAAKLESGMGYRDAAWQSRQDESS